MIFNFRKRTQEIPEKTTAPSKVRNFLPYIFVLIFVFGFFVPLFSVNAETNYQKCMRVENNEVLCSTSPATKILGIGANPFGEPGAQISGSTVATDPNAQINQPPASAKAPESLDCGWTDGGLCILASFSLFIMKLASYILWLSGTLLNLVIDKTIIQMATSVNGMTGIDITWRVIRDVVNISFIFILVYEGIMIILSRSNPSNALKMVGGIILTAVLINFSVFFTKVVIDASNVATIGFYKSIEEAGKNQAAKISETTTVSGGISGAFINSLKLTSLFNPDTITSLGTGNNNAYQNIAIVGLGGTLLFLVLAFVFFAISAMFVIRYITFIVLLMFSPLGFIGWGLPKMQSIQTKWWDALTGQAVFAPLYMFMTWVVLTLISSAGFFQVAADANYGKMFIGAKGAPPDASSISLVINFAIIIGLAIFSLTTAKEYASKGSTLIAKATGKLTAFAGGAVMGAGAMAGRNTIGRAGSLVANSDKLKDLASKGGFGGIASRLALRTSGKAAGATFDARNTGSVGALTGALGMDIGKGGKGTYKSVLDDKEKKQKAFVDSLKPSAVATAVATENAEKNKNEAVGNRTSKQNEINDPEFIARENKAKEDYLNSPEYAKIKEAAAKEVEENKAKQKVIDDETAQKTKLDKELVDLEAGAKAKTAFMGKAQIDAEISAKKAEIEAQNKKIEEVKKINIIENTAALESKKAADNFVSDEKKTKNKELEELVKLEKEAVDGVAKVKSMWADRAEAYATNVVESNKWTSLAWNAITNGVGYDTESERLAMGAKIRAQAKGKTDDQIIAEAAARKLAKENKDKENQNAPAPAVPAPVTTPTP